MLSYALLAYSLPPGHVFQSRIEGLEGFSDLTTASENIQRAVREFANPDVESPQQGDGSRARREGEDEERRRRAETTVTVLNGNGVSGSASNASYLLGQRGYPMVIAAERRSRQRADLRLLPHDRLLRPASAPARRRAAKKVANLFGSADVKQDRRR